MGRGASNDRLGESTAQRTAQQKDAEARLRALKETIGDGASSVHGAGGVRLAARAREWRRTLLEATDPFLPREHAGYFRACEEKHFGDRAVGSVFDSPTDLRELLGAGALQEGGLLRDDSRDRAALIADGAPADAFLGDCRYLRVPARGRMGMLRASELDPDTRVIAIRTKPGAPCSPVIFGQTGADCDFATVIIGPNEPRDGTLPSTSEMLFTAHPGPPVKPPDGFEEGEQLTVGEVLDRFGDIFLQVAE